MNKTTLMMFCLAVSAPTFAADNYNIRLAFQNRTVEGANCSPVEYRIRPQFGITVTECSNISETCPIVADTVPGLGYENAVRLNSQNIYTECQFIEIDKNTALVTLLFSCLEMADPTGSRTCADQPKR